jgi:hypothetical protein
MLLTNTKIHLLGKCSFNRDFHRGIGAQPDAAGWKPVAGSLLQKDPSPYELCQSVEAIWMVGYENRM